MNICSDNYDPKGYSLLINMQMYLGSCPTSVRRVASKSFLSRFL